MKRIQLLHVTVVLLFTLFATHSAYAISELGNNPFCDPALESAEQVRSMLIEKKADVKKGLAKAGYPQLFEPMYQQLPDVEIVPVEYQRNQELEWMFYRKKGKGPVLVDQGVIWESDTPLASYEFNVDYDGKRYTMSVPPICGNLALAAIGPIPAKPVVAPPVSQGESAAGSPGTGAAPQVAEVEEVESARWPILVDGGYLHQLDPAHHLFVRIGTEYEINSCWSIIGMLGVAPKISGDDGESALIADLFANYNFSRFFLGLGLGAWLTDGDSDNDAEDSDLDLIINLGARIFGEPDSFNTSVFIEARSGVDELDDFDLYGRIGGGLRFRF